MDKVAIGKRIRKRRMELKFAQNELAELIGVKKSHLCDVENGRVGLSVESLVLLVKYLHTTYDYILHGKKM